MNLTQYFLATDDMPYKLADRAGVARNMVYELLKREQGQGKRRVALENAQKLVEASGHKLTLLHIGQGSIQDKCSNASSTE